MKNRLLLIIILFAGLLSTLVAAPPAGSPKVEQEGSFAKDLALAGWRKTGEDLIVTLVNIKTREYTRLKNHDPAPNGMIVKLIHESERMKDFYVELELNGETANARFPENYPDRRLAPIDGKK
jgi:hypothetical protein